MWEAIQSAGTPLTLIAFVVAVAAVVYRHVLRSRIAAIKSAPEDARASLVDKLSETYSITNDNLTRKQKFDLMMEVLDRKAARFRLAAIVSVALASIFAIVLVVSLLADNDNTAPETPSKTEKRAKVLKVSLHELDSDLSTTVKDLGTETFSGDSKDTVAKMAAEWVTTTLNEIYPREEKQLLVTVHIDRDSQTLKFSPEDKLRRVHVWLFGTNEDENGKTHPTIDIAPEATSEAIVSNDPFVVHYDRVGYDLRYVELPKDDGKSTPIGRLDDPAMTVWVDEIKGSEDLGELLRGHFSSTVRVIDRNEVQQRKQAYDESRESGLSHAARITAMRKSRVDAKVTGAYSEELMETAE